ncbi:MAG: aminotransferase class I/II-fold pyridoxal phosphate-dependent enzyme [Candidatus Heimdallarchaeaceae archaeon]
MVDITKIERVKKLLKRERQLRLARLNDVYMKPLSGVTDRNVVSGDKEYIMLGSYSYLGLINHPEIKKASQEAIEKYGTGAGGVRLLTGTLELHKELEKKIAEFKKTEDAIVYSSGYVTNEAILSSIFGQNDLIVIDRFAHASIYSGCKLSKADWTRFQHNDMEDLERVLKENREKYDNIVIAVDGVYSMDGDVAHMPEIIELAKKYDAFTMVDEAHAIGVLGETGKGVEEYFGLKPDDIDIKMGTLSKAIPSIGGYVAGKKDLITYLRYSSSPFIFSAALPPASAAAALKALEIIETDIDRVKQLRENSHQFIKGVNELGYNTLKSKDTAIIPVIIGGDLKTFRFAKKMEKEGIIVPPVVYPAVPRDGGRLRCCVMATHTKEDMDKILKAFAKVGKELGVI